MSTLGTSSPARMTGIGRVLVVVYAIMALAATGRSAVQILEDWDNAPLAYALSAAAALVYILATVALVRSDARGWYTVAWIAISFELVGVLVVGTLSLTHPELFSHDATVWSGYGYGYFWVPLVLPFVGIWWLVTHRGGAPVYEPQEAVEERSSW
ncbi:hypothetical protein PFZ49_09105 [Microbacterium lacticum]|uniref:DNA uptake lipoprotein n=1 Tax=Microbacterium lacticum TaxID=33885 RepID=A0A4Y3UP47_9MICO|nr:hypothetical protein [Microbacterium lacticum]TQM95137.1 hypothetical protein FHX68_2477 [Microbacterium lacticum]GEB95932.1 hypothetical protein MLA01_21510 [Microbacterium lacticum]GGI70221.1 hypothetical protein GCM10009724_21490 [Microbacterium lacticum]